MKRPGVRSEPRGPSKRPVRGDEKDNLAIVRMRAGDRAAFDELVRRWRGPATHFAKRICQHADDRVAEVVELSFLTVLEKQEKEFDLGTSFKNWFLSIVRVHARRETTLVARLSSRPIDDQAKEVGDADALSPEREAIFGDGAGRATELLDRLPALVREAMLLRVVEELEFEEIGRLMDTTARKAEKRVLEGRTLLKQWLAEPDAEDGEDDAD